MSEEIGYLIIPGWNGSGTNHWQSHWQLLLPNSKRIHVESWSRPDLEDWIEAIDRDVRNAPTDKLVLIAHSLGCVAVAHWAQRHGARRADRIKSALLVAPADTERELAPVALQPFAPIPDDYLPFPSLVVGSTNDRAASADRARDLALHWGSEFELLPGVGHINTESGHQRWIEGLRYLARASREPAPRVLVAQSQSLSPHLLSY
ncbi:RBBP9/YdeN family alpha/beta hydrolase [Marinobacter subterrani]|uniref:RBBP9/YdeN family alpha/beta hydrolase n=1 Tax=Marinobacter subterrani TaxID=1658765 RepID=UPI002354DF1A|nr:alpha/beta hydrolase [Marinobacter subterrani]